MDSLKCLSAECVNLLHKYRLLQPLIRSEFKRLQPQRCCPKHETNHGSSKASPHYPKRASKLCGQTSLSDWKMGDWVRDDE